MTTERASSEQLPTFYRDRRQFLTAAYRAEGTAGLAAYLEQDPERVVEAIVTNHGDTTVADLQWAEGEISRRGVGNWERYEAADSWYAEYHGVADDCYELLSAAWIKRGEYDRAAVVLDFVEREEIGSTEHGLSHHLEGCRTEYVVDVLRKIAREGEW